MTPPPSTPKKPRRVLPKIIGHTSPTPRSAGTPARTSLRTLAPAVARPCVRPPTGAPGMRGFPRARTTCPSQPRGGRASQVNHTGQASQASQAIALREQAEAKAEAALDAAQAPTKRKRKPKPGPARPAVTGRPSTPDEPPLTHAPAAARLADPPLRTAIARIDKPPVAHRSRRRVELSPCPGSRSGEPTVRPRPSRILAELADATAALADEATTAD